MQNAAPTSGENNTRSERPLLVIIPCSSGKPQIVYYFALLYGMGQTSLKDHTSNGHGAQ